ncbi:hypothetical protein [Paraburkholderia metrosideri]|uniref:Toxic protein SymE n=1 Tax=Paraburkholderia metrosideri TaxID=580937 RepID=A0ABM8NY35_9BURK|nr:hypothetical protein [Paraburkholderia metrosideri]CAD6548919.1 hypothetical protein LMG28140_04681 [Paraburkholderia metrosideri]
MADANLKPRRARDEHATRISVELEQAPATDCPQEQHRRLAFPWRQIADSLLERAGFRPGQRVMFSVDHRFGHIIIAPDRNYTIAGRQMTPQQIRQRNSFITD